MCGIAGTVYRKEFLPGVEVTADELAAVVSQVKEGKQSVSTLLEMCWQYKSNINFLRYCKDDAERTNIDTISENLRNVAAEWLTKLPVLSETRVGTDFREKLQEYESLLDCHWFLDREVRGLFDSVRFYLGESLEQHHDSTVVFYKALTLVINAIDNRLEFRGRDSLGLSIQVQLSENWHRGFGDGEDHGEMYFESLGNTQLATFVFKTANPIGRLGDNARALREQLRNQATLNDIVVGGGCEGASIVIHTRWASIGQVNLSNCHPILNVGKGKRPERPLILAAMNGEIYNYEELLSLAMTDNLDDECTSDCIAVPASLDRVEEMTVDSIRTVINSFVGSYTLAIQSSKLPGQVVLVCRGKQGLYIGKSYDSVMFASDVYGLIESCRSFVPVESGSLLTLSSDSCGDNDDFEIDISSLNQDEARTITRSQLRTTNITTRDIDKGKYRHFLEKEIGETKSIVQKTLLSYFRTTNSNDPYQYLDSIVMDEDQFPEFIIDRFKAKRVTKVIITGMGTCYTAAAAIAMYMRTILRRNSPEIQVEPHIASEGSAFYLKHNMTDTLVIVIAQSGTSIDTNVYVQMAKERGAMSLAIANKRDGDVTFIVDGTLYIGNGRDVEIAVPSTKTYSAQVILGYILALYLCCRLAERDQEESLQLGRHIKLLSTTPKLIDQTFESLDQERCLELVRDRVCQHNSWYVVHDDSPNSVCAMEIRIKYSEGCYHSLPYLHVDEAISSNVCGAFITLVTNKRVDEIEKNLLDLLDRGNSLIVLCYFSRITRSLKRYVADRQLSVVSLPPTDLELSFLPTIIAGQLLSYYSALTLDGRKSFFIELTDAIRSDCNFEEKWKALRVAIANRTFDEGFSVVQFIHLQSLVTDFRNEQCNKESESGRQLLSFLDELYQFTRRPIDTIKHQAKTITVGAVRENSNVGLETNLVEWRLGGSGEAEAGSGATEIDRLASLIDEFDDEPLFERLGKYKKFFVYVDGLGETYRNFIVNFLNEMSNRYDLKISVRPAKYYELSTGRARPDVFWIFVSDGIQTSLREVLDELRPERYVMFDFSLTSMASCSIPIPRLLQAVNESEDYALGCCYVAHVVMKVVCRMNGATTLWVNNSKKELKDMSSAWEHVATSRQLKSELNVAAKIFLSKRHWKCIGSGVNYNVARYAANKLTSQFDRPCAFDVLENHKHIDISAEAAVLTFVANIWRPGYQSDVLAEIEKLLSHNNVPIIFTNIGDSRFDKLKMKIEYGDQKDIVSSPLVVQMPKLSEVYTYPLNVLVVTKMIEELMFVSGALDSDSTPAIARELRSALRIRSLFEDSAVDVNREKQSSDVDLYSTIALNDPSTLGILT